MARAMSCLCEILPSSKRIWSMGSEKHWTLPVKASDESSSNGGLRKRIASFTYRSEGNNTRSGGSDRSSWSLRRSQIMPSEHGGTALWTWWEWGCGWLASKKKNLRRKVSFFDDEELILGGQRSFLGDAFCKLRAHFRKLVSRGPVRHQGFNYDSFNYSQNFDNGELQHQGGGQEAHSYARDAADGKRLS